MLRFARSFRSSAGTFSRRAASSFASSFPSSSRTLLTIGVGAGVGVLAVAAVQAATSSTSTNDGFKNPVRRRLQNTYGYVAVNLAGTAGAAAMLFRSGIAHRLMAVNPIVLGIGSVAALMGTMFLTRSIDYYESPFAKHLALASFVGCQVSRLLLMMSVLLTFVFFSNKRLF
jgi:hypothetical protein